MLLMTVMGVHLVGLPNEKVDGTVQSRMKF